MEYIEKSISPEVKQAILNGEYGISRSGAKAKFIGKTDDPDYPYHFIYYVPDTDLIHNSGTLSDTFLFVQDDMSNHDVVGLWKDREEPFNLEQALAGRPVRLRCGLQAYVRYCLSKGYKGNYPLQGYIINPDDADGITPKQWTLKGKELVTTQELDFDIVNMWQDSEPNMVTLTLPCPLKEPKDELWFIYGGSVRKSGLTKSSITSNDFEQAIYFGSKTDAQAWLDAMRNNRR